MSGPRRREHPPADLGVFISYRRRETSGYAGRLHDALSEHFGAERIFMDVTMEAGVDYTERIEDAIGSCGALIALIGGEWLTLTDERGHRRIDDPADLHRLEIEAGLARGVRVIPTLVQGARTPPGDQLPGSLQPLVRRQAVELSDGRWDYDVGRLIAVLERVLGAGGGERQGLGTRVRGHARRLSARVRRAARAHPWRVAYMLGLLSAAALALALLAVTGYFSGPTVTDFTYVGPRRGTSIARCAVRMDSTYAIRHVDFHLDGDVRAALDRQQDPPFNCGNRNENTWDTCFSHSRAQRLRPGVHRLTAVVEDVKGHTTEATRTVRTACP
jgi:TIR domain